MASPKKILIVAGEPSGDLHASNLVKDLKSLDPSLRFFGLGGNLSREAGVDVVYDISKLALIGLVEVIKNLSAVKAARSAVIGRIGRERPDLAILVDYPGFNLRLARYLKKRGIPVVYYISPQVWAWGAGRIKIIKECVRKVVVFFKFEEELYRRHGIEAEWVGHPLMETVKATLPRSETLKRYGLSQDKMTVALLPGSRTLEVTALLTPMLSAAALIKNRVKNVQFVIAKFKDLPAALYKNIMKGSGVDIALAEGDTYNIVAAADFAIVASGTATLETALLGKPFLLVYKVNFLTYVASQIVLRTPFLGLANIIAGREIVPELLQFDVTPEKIAERAVSILADDKRRAGIVSSLRSVAASLGTPGASERAARAIFPLLR
ncbi:MAG: lipid-A-disaccharide synthase [Candidatus Omnitrophota bacterium]